MLYAVLVKVSKSRQCFYAAVTKELGNVNGLVCLKSIFVFFNTINILLFVKCPKGMLLVGWLSKRAVLQVKTQGPRILLPSGIIIPQHQSNGRTCEVFLKTF